MMEFCEGGDMAERIKKQNGVLLEESVITDWFTQIALAVRYCHEKKILHRDIKVRLRNIDTQYNCIKYILRPRRT